MNNFNLESNNNFFLDLKFEGKNFSQYFQLHLDGEIISCEIQYYFLDQKKYLKNYYLSKYIEKDDILIDILEISFLKLQEWDIKNLNTNKKIEQFLVIGFFFKMLKEYIFSQDISEKQIKKLNTLMLDTQKTKFLKNYF